MCVQSKTLKMHGMVKDLIHKKSRILTYNSPNRTTATNVQIDDDDDDDDDGDDDDGDDDDGDDDDEDDDEDDGDSDDGNDNDGDDDRRRRQR